ncbi:MAG: STAS domain-containing protein [Victivallales bacterium]|nr:STAS domain-containing protein [Victivallales bacterium]MCF7889079.1 STAS domain-containing protein [Victivallales bacterium]
MAVTLNRNDGTVNFVFEGRMDTIKCMSAEKDVVENINENDQVVFDLKEVDYIASSFLRLCGRASNTVGVENFSVINVSPSVKKVFKIAGLANRLNIK